jgi:DNA-binding transcriptional LysR family regulator
MNWDDLRILQTVRNEGTYAKASARLRIDETTVARRLARLQQALGVTLFELVDGTRRPTRECEAIIAHIEAIARRVSEIAAMGNQAPGPVGRFRIASTSTIAEAVLAPRASALLTANPGLTLHFLTSGENVNFSRWEADFAIRLRQPDKGDFSISKLAELRLYHIEPSQPSAHGPPIVCSYPEELDLTPEAQFMKARGQQMPARCVTDNIRIIRALIGTHAAVGILPDYLCGDFLEDRGLRASPLPRRREVWLLMQNHLKRDPAARLVIEWIRACFAEALS